jgi:hypothetical protein
MKMPLTEDAKRKSFFSRRSLLTGSAALAADAALAGEAFSQGQMPMYLVPSPAFVPLSGSAFDMNFATNQYSVASLSNLTVTRAQTVPSYVDNPDGTVTSFAANTLRIAPGKGLLIEGASTNLAHQSADLSNAAWSTFANGTGDHHNRRVGDCAGWHQYCCSYFDQQIGSNR